MYYSIFDEDQGWYLHTGRNSKLKSTAIREWVGFYVSGDCSEEMEKKLKRDVKNKKWKAIMQHIRCYRYLIVRHKQKI